MTNNKNLGCVACRNDDDDSPRCMDCNPKPLLQNIPLNEFIGAMCDCYGHTTDDFDGMDNVDIVDTMSETEYETIQNYLS